MGDISRRLFLGSVLTTPFIPKITLASVVDRDQEIFGRVMKTFSIGVPDRNTSVVFLWSNKTIRPPTEDSFGEFSHVICNSALNISNVRPIDWTVFKESITHVGADSNMRAAASRVAVQTRRGKANHYAKFSDGYLVWYKNPPRFNLFDGPYVTHPLNQYAYVENENSRGYFTFVEGLHHLPDVGMIEV